MEFVYKAVTRSGKEKKGNIDAEDETRAALQLKSMGLVPVEIKKATFWTRELDLSFGSGVKARDLGIFCRQFVSMLQAGVTITDCLSMLAQQTENKKMARAIHQVQSDVEKGEPLSGAMKKHPKIFPRIMISMATAGEASGKLETCFLRMSEHFEKDARIRGMIKKASVYPIMVAIVAVIVIIVLLVKVVPSYMELFEDMDVEMPAITRGVIDVSTFLQAYWGIVLLVAAGVIAAINTFRKTEQGEHFFGTIARNIPIFGKLNIKTQASIFSRTLSTLLASGIPMIEALDIVSGTMTNALYRDALKEAKEEVAKGVPLSEPLGNSDLFPPMVTHMTRIGEETGEIEEMLDRLAAYYDEEVEMTTQTVMAALEPMIIIAMAVIVVFVVAAVMAPMTAMYSGLDNL